MLLSGKIFSKTFEMETGITIVAPNDLKKNSKVVYLLHGLCGSSGDWVKYTKLPLYANNYDVIFILPEVNRSFYVDMEYGFDFFTYITQELPEICKNLLNISTRREDTAVFGNSMGGYGALKCALTYPENYGLCCAFSPACVFLKNSMDSQRKNIEKAKEIFGKRLVNDFESAFGKQLNCTEKDELMLLAKKIENNDLKPKVYCSCGDEDFMHEDIINFSKEMYKLNFDFEYEEWKGIHDWNFFDQAIEKALKKHYVSK